ncbi:MAG: hypothetical protein GEV11_06985 [Streptosporangiales bacterium]|nr:hypothetical protein [Streptosporangiales bacterium]
MTEAVIPAPVRLFDLIVGAWVSQAITTAAELDGRRFALTELGELLREDHPGSLRGWALLHGRAFHREVWAGLTDSVRLGGSTYDAVTGRTLFDHFAEHPEDAAVLNDAMTSMSRTIVLPLAEAYDYGPFDTIPADGDAYVLCNVVHDWGDDEAVRILANCKVAMNDRRRVLLGEFVLSEGPGGNDPMQIWADLAMLVMTSGGKQRTRAELAELVHRAGMRLSRIIPAANGFSVVEGVPA